MGNHAAVVTAAAAALVFWRCSWGATGLIDEDSGYGGTRKVALEMGYFTLGISAAAFFALFTLFWAGRRLLKRTRHPIRNFTISMVTVIVLAIIVGIIFERPRNWTLYGLMTTVALLIAGGARRRNRSGK